MGLADWWRNLSTGGRFGVGLGGAAAWYAWKRHQDRANQRYMQNLQNLQDQADAANDYDPWGDGSYISAITEGQEAREANIESALAKVAEMFGGRQPLYDGLADDTYALGKEYLDDERINAEGELTASLARAGLSGGSVDIGKRKELNTRYLDGLSMARAEADAAAAGYKNQDMALKNQLIGLAAGGNVSGEQLAQFGTPTTSVAAAAPSNLGQTFVGLTDMIGAARNPFAFGLSGGGAGSTGRPSSIGSRYEGNVVT